jgi:N-acetylmuramoyl-L-alanine amidase
MGKAIATALIKYVNNLKLNTIDDSEIAIEETLQEDSLVFKIQISSGKSKIETKSYNFKGLKNIERVKIGGYYKYYYGHSKDYQSVQKKLKIARQKGYKSAFVVALKNGKKISLKEARKLL